MQDSAAFAKDAYKTLNIRAKFTHIRTALLSIIKILSPASERRSQIDLPYIDNLIIEIGEYGKLFASVVEIYPEEELCNKDIQFVEQNCKSAKGVYEELYDALDWLRTAHDALEAIEESKRNSGSFSTRQRKEYYDCLKSCRSALMAARKMLEDVVAS